MVAIVLCFKDRNLPRIKLSLDSCSPNRIILKTISLNVEKIGKQFILSMTIELNNEKIYTVKLTWKGKSSM